MRAVEIDEATGKIYATWNGGDRLPEYPTGRVGIVIPDSEPFPSMTHQWDNTEKKFVAGPPVAATIDPQTEQLARIENKVDDLLSK